METNVAAIFNPENPDGPVYVSQLINRDIGNDALISLRRCSTKKLFILFFPSLWSTTFLRILCIGGHQKMACTLSKQATNWVYWVLEIIMLKHS